MVTPPPSPLTGAYERDDVYAAVAARDPECRPSSSRHEIKRAVPGAKAEAAPTQRDRHLQSIAKRGRMS
jgi:hypothetical protein